MLQPSDLKLSTLANFPVSEDWIDGKIHIKPDTGGYGNQKGLICHRCGRPGHKSTYCQDDKITDEELNEIIQRNPMSHMNTAQTLCFNCKQKGHYADKCPLKLN